MWAAIGGDTKEKIYQLLLELWDCSEEAVTRRTISVLDIPVLPISSDLQELIDQVKTYEYDDQDLKIH